MQKKAPTQLRLRDVCVGKTVWQADIETPLREGERAVFFLRSTPEYKVFVWIGPQGYATTGRQ